MSLKKKRDFKSQPKRTRSESERTANNLAERKKKRPKSKRVASPTPSYLSVRTDRSMDPPTNFKGGDTFPLHSQIKRKRQTSPVTSYISLKSDNSMNDSRGNTSMQRVREDSPTPTCLSLRTDWSMDPPTNFRPAETFPLHQRLLTEHHLKCPLCKSMLKDPVSIPCGHNYCSGCINEFWVSHAEDYVCPQCGNISETRPVLNTNAALAEVVKNLQHAGFSPALPPQSYAGLEDVACDFCTERRLKAVKCCSTCGIFLCETHIKPHYTVAALQKHTLSDVTGDMKTRPSEQHQNTVSSFSSTVSVQQDQRDKTLDIKEMAVGSIFESVLKPDKLQTQPIRSAKPKTRGNKEVRSLVHMCSTLKKEMSGLRTQLSKISKRKNTKKEKHYEEDRGKEEEEDEDCSEKDSDERSDDEGRDDDSSDEEEYGSENSCDEEEYGSGNSSDEEQYGSGNSADEEEYGSHKEDGEDSRDDDEEDNSAYSDEEFDDKYSEGYSDHSSEEYSTEDEDDGY